MVEVLIPANSSAINYPLGSQYTNLQGGMVTKIEVIPASICPVSPSGVPVVNATVLAKAYLETQQKSKTLLNKMPLRRLDPFLTLGNAPEQEPFKIDVANSKITLGNTAGISATDEVIMLLFYYE